MGSGGGYRGGRDDGGESGASGSGSPRHRATTQLTEPQETRIVRDRDDEFQMMRHVVLLLFLCGSMIVVGPLFITNVLK